MVDREELEKRADAFVDEGVRRLDAKQSKSRRWWRGRKPWRERIKIRHIQQENPLACVLAQVFGDYETGLDILEIGLVEAGSCGFALGEDFMTWEALNNAWKRRLQHPA